MVACSTCVTICPSEAIHFPGRELIWKVEQEHKIFREVRKEVKKKRTKVQIARIRSEVEQRLAQTTTQIRMQIAGEFGERQLLVQLWNLLDKGSYDIVNLKLDVPTVKGLKRKHLLLCNSMSFRRKQKLCWSS